MVKFNFKQLNNFQIFIYGFIGFLFSSIFYDLIKTILYEYIKIDKDNIRDQIFIVFILFLTILFFIFNIQKELD